MVGGERVHAPFEILLLHQSLFFVLVDFHEGHLATLCFVDITGFKIVVSILSVRIVEMCSFFMSVRFLYSVFITNMICLYPLFIILYVLFLSC